MSAAVSLKPEFKAEKPQLLFEGPYVMIGSQSYDVSLTASGSWCSSLSSRSP